MKSSTSAHSHTGLDKNKAAAAAAASAPRRKLKPSDNAMWSDNVIESLTYGKADSSSYAIPKEMISGPFKDSMEEKIARVKARQKEAEDRANKQSLMRKSEKPSESAVLKETLGATISKYINGRTQNKQDILNTFFEEFFLSNPALLGQYEVKFPLHYFDSTLFDEQLRFTDGSFPLKGSYLAPFEEESSNRIDGGISGFGVFVPCSVLKVVDSDHVQILLDSSDTKDQAFNAPRMEVVADNHDISQYCLRVTTALQRRRDCISLLKFHFNVINMPYSQTVVPTLTDARKELIRQKVMSMACIANVNPNIFAHELEIVIRDFRTAQNLILFSADMLSPTNYPQFLAMNLPVAAFKKNAKVPYLATVPTLAHNSKDHQSYLQLESFLGSKAAIAALQSAVGENINISTCQIINILYEKTMTLEKYERYITEQMMASVRAIKQEWVTKTGVGIRTAIQAFQDEAGLSIPTERPGCAVLDLSIRNVHEYNKTSNIIKSFLERVNFMMAHVLTTLISNNIREFTDGIVSLCSSEVNVKDIRNIQVIMPPNSIYKLKVLPPLFSVSFRVTVDDRLLNGDDLDKNKKEIASWNKTKEALEGGKCPIAVVKPVMGKTFEYNYSTEDFKTRF